MPDNLEDILAELETLYDGASGDNEELIQAIALAGKALILMAQESISDPAKVYSPEE